MPGALKPGGTFSRVLASFDFVGILGGFMMASFRWLFGGPRYHLIFAAVLKRDFEDIGRSIEAGVLKPIIDRYI